jgi:hypothetical protein
MFLAVATWYPWFIAMKYFGPGDHYSPVFLSFTVFVMVGYVALCYGPIAAYLVELFPTQVRYTSMSFPYHIGNGVFGGLVPVIGLSITSASGNIYGGLWYPMIVAGVTFFVMLFLMPETYQTNIRTLDHDDDRGKSVF